MRSHSSVFNRLQLIICEVIRLNELRWKLQPCVEEALSRGYVFSVNLRSRFVHETIFRLANLQALVVQKLDSAIYRGKNRYP